MCVCVSCSHTIDLWADGQARHCVAPVDQWTWSVVGCRLACWLGGQACWGTSAGLGAHCMVAAAGDGCVCFAMKQVVSCIPGQSLLSMIALLTGEEGQETSCNGCRV